MALTNIKDVDLKILSDLDDRDLLNFCKNKNKYVYKICSNEIFWKDRFYTKYGIFEKSSERTWKNFYLKIIYYNDRFTSPDTIIYNLTKEGSKNIDLINFFIEKGATDLDSGLFAAAFFGDETLVNFYIQKGANDLQLGLRGAVQGGQKKFIDFFIQQGAIIDLEITIFADKNIIRYLLKKRNGF